MKTQIFEKKGKLSSEKKFVAYFFSYYRVSQASVEKLCVPKSYSDKYCEIPKSIFLGPNRLLKTQIFFKKKAIFPVKKLMWPIFSRSIENDKGQGWTYKGPEGL